MGMEIVRCKVCDNQMPISTHYCFVCGTENPFYKVYLERQDQETEPAPGSEGAPASSDATEHAAPPTPARTAHPSTEDDGDYDLSALFAEPAQPEPSASA